jgi:hypothetical protein
VGTTPSLLNETCSHIPRRQWEQWDRRVFRTDPDLDCHMSRSNHRRFFGRIAAMWPRPSKTSRNRAFGDREAELAQVPVDLRRAPVGILGRHSTDESPNLFAHFRPAALGPRSPAPVQAKPARCHPITVSGFTMIRTSDHRGQRLRRVGPEETVEEVQGRAPVFAFERCDLLGSARISSEVSRRLWKKTRKAARTAGIKLSTNQRCNTRKCWGRCDACIANCGF